MVKIKIWYFLGYVWLSEKKSVAHLNLGCMLGVIQVRKGIGKGAKRWKQKEV